MIDGIDPVTSHSIYPTLFYANKIYGTKPTLNASIVDTINNTQQATATNIFSIIQGREEISSNPLKILLQNSPYVQYKEEDISEPNVLAGLYLQYPNDKLRKLALTIVNPNDSNDMKMQKISAWVIKNIKYVEDETNYGYEELWAAPTMTLSKKSGDCEDGAFLIHSLALNAGVPADRLRTYGGLVKAGEGAAQGGHGWTAYQRESDDEWVVVDWCYYPENVSTNNRTLMKDDKKYIDDYFYMTLSEYVTTEYSNRVREPNVYDNMGSTKQNIWLSSLIDILV